MRKIGAPGKRMGCGLAVIGGGILIVMVLPIRLLAFLAGAGLLCAGLHIMRK